MTGHINQDIFSYDIKRFQKFHSDLGFIKKRITETLGDLYGMHWPFKQHKTSRNIKTLPYHDNLKVLEHVLVFQLAMKDQCGLH